VTETLAPGAAAPSPAGLPAWLKALVRPLRALGLVLVAVAIVMGLNYGFRWFINLPAFAIEQVRIEGELHRNSADELRSEVLSRLPGNFFTLDLADARDELEAVPWVRSATVRRLWPDQLVVHIEEHQPLAVWREQGLPDRLLNRQGEIFEANLGEVDNLPELEGGRGQSGLLIAMYGKLVPRLAQLDTVPVRLSLSPRGSWQVELKRGEIIELGRGADEDVLERLERFIRAVGRTGSRWSGRGWDRADLRHVNGFALHLTAALAPAAQPADQAQ
jgi:cell division protein FtsQ